MKQKQSMLMCFAGGFTLYVFRDNATSVCIIIHYLPHPAVAHYFSTDPTLNRLWGNAKQSLFNGTAGMKIVNVIFDLY